MGFERNKISSMKEAEFQEQVVIPLFKAMGFRDVTPVSGGSLEQGKDVVMWKQDELAHRLNYAVVIKAVPISGKAKGTNTASETLNQIRQCFTEEFPDPVTTKSQAVDRVFVVSSHLIKKEAITSIKGQLKDSHFDKLVSWIHPGSNLYGLIEDYLPQVGTIEKLEEIKSSLNAEMGIVPYRIVADTDKNFAIKVTDKEAAKRVPFDIKTQIEFDVSTPDGKAKRDELIEHFRTGRPLEIEGKFIKQFKLPDFIPDWMQPNVSEEARLLLRSSPLNRIIPLCIERRLASGETVSSGRIDFKIAHHGSEQVTLRNDHQGGPLEIELIFDLPKPSLKVNLGCHMVGFGAYELLNALRFCSALAEDGETDIMAVDVGLKLVTADKGKIGKADNFSGNMKLLRALIAIQDAFKVPIIIPDRDISDSDIRSVNTLMRILSEGRIPGKLKRIDAGVDLESTDRSFHEFADEQPGWVKVQNELGMNVKIFDLVISLAPCVIVANAYIPKDEFERISSEMEAGQQTIDFEFAPINEEVIFEFPSYENPDKRFLENL